MLSKNGWILTDQDDYQWIRKLDEGIYEGYMTATGFHGETQVIHAVIDIDSIDIKNILECYGYESVEELRGEVGEEYVGQILAECQIEIYAGCNENVICNSPLTYDEAAALIDKLIS